ncbi:MAG: hypothetical protein WD749_01960 [Phycisphaerales bacterium]
MGGAGVLAVFASVLAVIMAVLAAVFLVVPVFKGLAWLVRQLARFVFGEIGDALRIVGALVTQLVFLPLVIVNILIGRWSAAAHYGRAVSAECKVAGAAVYRMVIGHPARLLCLTALTDGIEKRIPAAMAAAPGADAPSIRRAGQFEGYTIVGSLPGGGSGGKLYVAEPDPIRRAAFERAGQHEVRQVVIKTFSLRDGSSLPQIVRESRALDAAKRLGLVLDHELTDERFFYVMRYVPGESLSLVTQRLHAAAGSDGLDAGGLGTAMGYGSDLLRTLDAYHRGGLWHKDVKPDNIIVGGAGVPPAGEHTPRPTAHLVDFGLVTPLRSAMTLTTHGTEYFRDPEMVRLALKGVKVDQVNGAKFDVYAAGAVLFSIVENSFPAHGGLSQITRRCPEALRWVVRRGMAEYEKRYATAGEMLADLEYIRRAADPSAVKPFELPSMRPGAESESFAEVGPIRRTPEPVEVGAGSGEYQPLGQARADEGPRAAGVGFGAAGAAAAMGGAAAVGAAGPAVGPPPRHRPPLRVDRGWTGGYVSEDAANGHAPGAGPTPFAAPPAGAGFYAGMGSIPEPAPAFDPAEPLWRRRAPAMSAREQVAHARERGEAARERARAHGRRHRTPGDFSTMNVGVGLAVVLLLAAVSALFLGVVRGKSPTTTVYRDRAAGTIFASGEVPAPATLAGTERRIGPGARAAVKGERALVISDMTQVTPAITAAVGRLKTAGFQLVGNFPGNDAGPGEIEHQLALEVDARRVRDMGSLEDLQVRARLASWLAEQRDLGLVVWFAKGGEGGTDHYFVVTPKTPKAKIKERDTLFRTGMDALAGPESW